MKTAKFIKFSGVKDHLANMEIGEGEYEHKFMSRSEMTKNAFGYDQVLLTVKTNEPNEWELIRDLNKEFNGAGFQPW